MAIGEAKWRSRPVGVTELDRLRRLRESLPGGPADVRLMLFGSSGFTPELLSAAGADVELIDLERLYTGS